MIVSESPEIVVAGRRIGPAHPPFIVAEMSGNHNGSLATALAIVDGAASAGAHALKLQTFTADTMTLEIATPLFQVTDATSPWHGRRLYDLYREAALPWEWHQPIFDRCRQRGLIPFSTPFDESAVERLESLGAPAYKIASMESTDLSLIRRVSATGKPILISTGATTFEEIAEAVDVARGCGAREIALLKCTAEYPADPADADLATMQHMRDHFGVQVGLSDHTLGIGVSIAAVALGAVLIERHLTLRRSDGGIDASFSLEPDELRLLVEESMRAWKAVGSVRYPSVADGKQSHRRTLFIIRDVKAGDHLAPEDVRALRPGLGLPVRDLDKVLGRRARRDLPRGTPLSWEVLE